MSVDQMLRLPRHPGLASEESAVRPRPSPDIARTSASALQSVTVRVDVVNAVTSRERTLIQAAASLIAGGGVLLVIPMAILLLGLPVVLTVRAFIEALRWVLE